MAAVNFFRIRVRRVATLAKLKPAFPGKGDAKDLSVTAGNASSLNDGGAALVVTSREFASPPSDSAKMKSPFEYAVSAVRMLGAESDGGPAMQYWLAQMGGSIFGRVTPDGYPDRAAAWLSTGTLIERMNFAVALANNRIAGTHYPAAKPADVALVVGSPRFQMR